METVSIYESIARNLGDIYAKGTGTNCTATTAQSNALTFPNSQQLSGKEIYWYSGAGAGQARIIASFNVGSHAVIHDYKYDTTPSDNPKFLIFRKFRAEDYESAVNRAIGKVRLVHLDDFVATMALNATQYEYVVPSGMEWISTIKFVPSAGSDYRSNDDIKNISELPPRFWRIEGNQGGSRIIAFDSKQVNLNNFDKQICRVEGQCKPDFNGTNVSESLQEYVITHASMVMAGTDKEFDKLFYMMRNEIQGKPQSGQPGLENYIYSNPRGRKVYS